MLPHIICTGSYEFLAYAKSKGRQALANAMLMGGVSNCRQTLPNGGTLIITVSLPSTYTIILTDGGVEVLSGAIAPGEYISYQDPVTSNTLYAIDSFEPSSLQVSGNPPLSRDWRSEKKLGDNNRNYFTSERFTGKMRMAMQLFYGTKHDLEEYRSDFYVSHGIHVDLNGRKWLIEISAYGVLAKPFTGSPIKASTSIKSAAKSAGISLVPSGKAFYRNNTAPDYTKIKTLISPTEIKSIFYRDGVYAIHRSIGWAFNYSGTKASNIALWMDGGNIKSGLFTISIDSDENGPYKASVSIVESGYFKDSDINSIGASVEISYLKTNTVAYGGGPLPSMPNQFNNNLSSSTDLLVLNGPAYCYYSGDILFLWHCESKIYNFRGQSKKYVGFVGPGITNSGNPKEDISVTSVSTSADGPLVDQYGNIVPDPGYETFVSLKLYGAYQLTPTYPTYDYVTFSFGAKHANVNNVYDGVKTEPIQIGLDCYRSVNFSGVNRESSYIYQHDEDYGGLKSSSGRATREYRFSDYVMTVVGTSSGNQADPAFVASEFNKNISEMSAHADSVNRALVVTSDLGMWNYSSQTPLLSISNLSVFNHDDLTVYPNLGSCGNAKVAEYCGKSSFLGSSYHHCLIAKIVNGGHSYSTVNVFKTFDSEVFVGHVGDPISYMLYIPGGQSYPTRDKIGYPLVWVGYS